MARNFEAEIETAESQLEAKIKRMEQIKQMKLTAYTPCTVLFLEIHKVFLHPRRSLFAIVIFKKQRVKYHIENQFLYS